MLRISLSFIYNYARQIEPIANFRDEGQKLQDIALDLLTAKGAIEGMHSSLFGPYLRTCYQAYETLLANIDLILKDFETNKEIHSYQIFSLKRDFNEYRIALLAEIGVMNNYFVTQKGGFDTVSLLLWGENFFPHDLRAKVHEALFDVREATKCLAYELPTACGFHVFRALEAVLRRYYLHITGGAAPPKVRNIGVYLESLKRSGKGDIRILAAIKQIADLHRNPLIHPETVFSLEDAAGALGIVRSVISAMLFELPVPPATT